MGRRLRMTDTTTSPAPAPVHRISPDVWALALQYADGDRGRIRVTGHDAVVVTNQPHR